MYPNATLRRNDILYPELSFQLFGLCLQVRKHLGRFAREKQYCDLFAQLAKLAGLDYLREVVVGDTGNRIDFFINYLILMEFKAKPFLVKDDYYQTQRYLQAMDLRLGLLINFREEY